MRRIVVITDSAINDVVFESRKLGNNERLRMECNGELGKDVLQVLRQRLGKEYDLSHGYHEKDPVSANSAIGRGMLGFWLAISAVALSYVMYRTYWFSLEATSIGKATNIAIVALFLVIGLFFLVRKPAILLGLEHIRNSTH